MLSPAIADQAFQFGGGSAFNVNEAMRAIQHVELAQRRIGVAPMGSALLLAHEQTFGGATLEPKDHACFVR